MFQRATLEAFQRWLHNSSQQPQRALNLPSRGWQQSCAPSSCRGAQPQPPPTGGTPRCHPQPAPTQPQPLPTRGMLPTSSCQVSAPARADSGTGRPPQGSCMGGGHVLCPSSAQCPGCRARMLCNPIPSPPHPIPAALQAPWCGQSPAGQAEQGHSLGNVSAASSTRSHPVPMLPTTQTPRSGAAPVDFCWFSTRELFRENLAGRQTAKIMPKLNW